MKPSDIVTREIFVAANLVTAVRAIAMIPLTILLVYENRLRQAGLEYAYITRWLMLIGLLIVLSDFFDGKIARHFNQVTRFGRYFDPVCDKIAILGSVVLLVLFRGYPLFMLVFLYVREVLIFILSFFLFYRRSLQGEPNMWGKFGVGFIAFSFCWYLAIPLLPAEVAALAWLSYLPVIAVYLLGSYSYLRRYWRVLFHHETLND